MYWSLSTPAVISDVKSQYTCKCLEVLRRWSVADITGPLTDIYQFE